MLRAVAFIVLAGAISTAIGCRSTGGPRGNSGLAAAREAVGRDAAAEFRQNQQAKAVRFYSYGSLVKGEHFPGLSREDVTLWIGQRGTPFSREFQDDPAPFSVGENVTTEDYWSAVNDFLAAYNRLVLAYLKREHDQPSTPVAGVPPIGKTGVDRSP